MNARRLVCTFGLAVALAVGGVGAFGVTPVFAQLDTGLAQVGQTVKLSQEDPRVIAARIINVALGVIGIILVTLIIYAGFLYMTSSGEAEKTSRAKKIIMDAVIGLVIILSAWAITSYLAVAEGHRRSALGAGHQA
jgi:hypothetical protein